MNERWERNAVKQRHAREEQRAKEQAVIDAARALVPWPGDDWSHRIQAVLDAVRALDGAASQSFTSAKPVNLDGDR